MLKYVMAPLLALSFEQAAAIPMTVLGNEYKPLVYIDDNTTTGCGIQFQMVAITPSLDKKSKYFKSYFLTGSINNGFSFGDISTITTIKLLVSPIVSDNEPKAVPFKEFTFHIGKIITRDYIVIPTDTENARVYAKSIDYSAPEYLISELLNSNYRWLSFSFDGKTNLEVQMPKPDLEIYREYTSCMQDVVKTVEKSKVKK